MIAKRKETNKNRTTKAIKRRRRRSKQEIRSITHNTHMRTITFILSRYFYFAILIACKCETNPQRVPIPSSTNQTEPSDKPIEISSTESYAAVCIGSNNTITIGTKDPAIQAEKSTRDVNNSMTRHQNNLPLDGRPITIKATHPKGIVSIGSGNSIHISMPTEQPNQNSTEPVPTKEKNDNNDDEEEKDEEDEEKETDGTS
ncbi:hypothetical protein [Cardinium endosymbiont of Sogatella furcifera]|uniref:hypothetical protein n=1 Tax=Cardinium endosymbiont of Sogatella furcifera TaxID=650378 RepID=UPI0013B45DB6|nr:hypothetical protein [Cardinium endosymbiont of Sogatella furcifera]